MHKSTKHKNTKEKYSSNFKELRVERYGKSKIIFGQI